MAILFLIRLDYHSRRPTVDPRINLNLHDETFPHLLTWQQNFLLLHSLTITSAQADGFTASAEDGRDWQFKFTSGLAGWVAQYKGKTFMKPREIQSYNIHDWIKL